MLGQVDAATTDAEKAVRCCMHTYISKNDNYDVALTSAEVYGWPRVVYQYSQTCKVAGFGFKNMDKESAA